MVKKKISVGKYFRKKGGKTESVKAHDKTVNVKHNLSNNNRNAVINGNTKPLFNGNPRNLITAEELAHKLLSELDAEAREQMVYKIMDAGISSIEEDPEKIIQLILGEDIKHNGDNWVVEHTFDSDEYEKATKMADELDRSGERTKVEYIRDDDTYVVKTKQLAEDEYLTDKANIYVEEVAEGEFDVTVYLYDQDSYDIYRGIDETFKDSVITEYGVTPEEQKLKHNLSKEDYEKLSERQNELWDEYLEAHPRLQEYAVKHNLTNNDLRLLINQRKKDLEVSDKDYDQFLKTPDKVQKELIEATKKEIKETQRLVDPLSFNTNPKSKQIANSIKRTNENRLKQIAMQELYFEKAKDEMKENPKKR